ncbi:hypothetical protein M0811_04771 [Anaeramoeba ignava]|uniref:non-specific serine/threonine protein kinase n=1 Tax=Anaeramoeba ignava TaxID=1746090 RepID=A0A9Q0RF31_ANAIG|nr:hypothetical protein M0811_04771 [Anaeramoeba ignava]
MKKISKSKTLILQKKVKQIPQIAKTSSESEQEDPKDYKYGGYHLVNIGDIIKRKYKVLCKIGWGAFSTVWACEDFEMKRYVAIKIVKSAPEYTLAAQEEVKLLKKISDEDPKGEKHVVRLFDSFKIQGPNGTHICMVFELLGDKNLLGLLKENYLGIPMPIVKKLTKQILIALSHLHSTCQIIHTDIKPENIMLYEEVGSLSNTLLEKISPNIITKKIQRKRIITNRIKKPNLVLKTKSKTKSKSKDKDKDKDKTIKKLKENSIQKNENSIQKNENLIQENENQKIQEKLIEKIENLIQENPNEQKEQNSIEKSDEKLKKQLELKIANFQRRKIRRSPIPKKLTKGILKKPAISAAKILIPKETITSPKENEETKFGKKENEKEKEKEKEKNKLSQNDEKLDDLKNKFGLPQRPRLSRNFSRSKSADKGLTLSLNTHAEINRILRKPQMTSSQIDKLISTNENVEPKNETIKQPEKRVLYKITPPKIHKDVVLPENLSENNLEKEKEKNLEKKNQENQENQENQNQQKTIQKLRKATPKKAKRTMRTKSQSGIKKTLVQIKKTESKEKFNCKIIDFGNSCWIEHHFAQNIQTRQYRSPEVILGYEYNASADIWSLGCMIFELLTGDFLFNPKNTSNSSRDEEHLALIIELLGPFSKEFALGGKRSSKFFDQNGELLHIKRIYPMSLKETLQVKYHFQNDSADQIASFLLPMLDLDFKNRISAEKCLSSSWFNDNENDSNFNLTKENSQEVANIKN